MRFQISEKQTFGENRAAEKTPQYGSQSLTQDMCLDSKFSQ